MLCNQGKQRLLLAIGHQGQKRFITDHQGIPLKQRLQRGTTPELTSGIVGITNPKRRPNARFGECLREGRIPNKG